MSVVTVSSKRQIVLPAELCNQLAISAGTRLDVELGPDGASLTVRPAVPGEPKPLSDLFGRVGKATRHVPIEEMSIDFLARQAAKEGKL